MSTKNVEIIYTKTPEEIEQEEVSLVKRRYNSLAEAALNLQDKNVLLKAEIALCHEKLVNAQKNVDINQEIVRNSLLKFNNMKDSYIAEINELKAKLK